MPLGKPTEQTQSNRLKPILIGLFLFALIMGPGPGLYLINGYASEGGSIFGIPILYAWVVFWFLIEAGVVVTAYLKLWKEDDE